MPVLSYVHQLFNADQCQTYIHTLRWKDRPLQCPRCQSALRSRQTTAIVGYCVSHAAMAAAERSGSTSRTQ